jgi:hypothetical protein
MFAMFFSIMCDMTPDPAPYSLLYCHCSTDILNEYIFTFIDNRNLQPCAIEKVVLQADALSATVTNNNESKSLIFAPTVIIHLWCMVSTSLAFIT